MDSTGNTPDEAEATIREQTMNSERMVQFVELYTEYYPRLQYYLMALLPTSSDAADVLQDTSLVLWSKFSTFEIGTNFFAWACKIARLQALKHFERTKRSARLFDLGVLEKLAEDAEAAASRPMVPLEVLESCLGKLSGNDQMLIKRRYEPDASVKQLAIDIGRSANSISKSLGRIRRALHNCPSTKNL